MSRKLEVGDHVRWNTEAGYVSGKIIDVWHKGAALHEID